jgi:hypothetical protein
VFNLYAGTDVPVTDHVSQSYKTTRYRWVSKFLITIYLMMREIYHSDVEIQEVFFGGYNPSLLPLWEKVPEGRMRGALVPQRSVCNLDNHLQYPLYVTQHIVIPKTYNFESIPF